MNGNSLKPFDLPLVRIMFLRLWSHSDGELPEGIAELNCALGVVQNSSLLKEPIIFKIISDD